ncbi:peptidase inhibitor family I36 protein [Streptomyces sp. NPDC090135]|uniref:peptidase inhibitor family I36 protein n=1 Tax=Streptomyces sp. NPDC090135 TaxID=3365957 RepID=UPI0037F838D5
MSVTVYSDANYKGSSATLGAGRHKLDEAMNDCISSIRVPAGWKVTLFENRDFTGAKLTLDEDRWKVADALHDKASALLITEPGQEHDTDAPVLESSGDDWFYFEDETTSS